jgi:radical SAM-linked protein
MGTTLNMAPDTPAALATTPLPQTPPLRDKVRIRFRKDRDLRLLSHHDLLRTFERMLRRAELPVRRTQGFHPHPRLVFALSLPLGVVGCAEVVELELDDVLPLDEIRGRLMRQAPSGLSVLSIHRIDPKAGAQVRRLCYRIDLPPQRAADLEPRVAEVLRSGECRVERKRPPVRVVDLRPWISDLRLKDSHLEMDLWLTPEGTARPDEVLEALGIRDLLDAGAVLERAWLELHDEVAADLAPGPQSTGHNIDSSLTEENQEQDCNTAPITEGNA